MEKLTRKIRIINWTIRQEKEIYTKAIQMQEQRKGTRDFIN